MRAVASGESVVPGPPFEIGTPHFTFGPPVAAYIQYSILEMWPPLLVFGPPAAKLWRRACDHTYFFAISEKLLHENMQKTLRTTQNLFNN